MTTPRASISSPSSASLIPDDHDSVENEKDFAPLAKKFKVDKDLVGEEEHNTDSGENDMDFAKLKDLVGEEEEDNTPVPMSQDSAIDLNPREAFIIWCNIYGKCYEDQEEEDWRYNLFKQNLDKPIPSSNANNFPLFADRTEEEFAKFRRAIGQPDGYSSVSSKELAEHMIVPLPTYPVTITPSALMKFTAEEEAFQIWHKVYPKDLVGEEEDNTPVPMSQDSAIDLNPREAFIIWCNIYGKCYEDQEEEDWRYNLFKQNLDKAIPSSNANNFPLFADRTEEEFAKFRRAIGQPDGYSSVSSKELAEQFV